MTRGLRSLVLVVSNSIGAGPLGVLLITLGLIAGAFLSMKSHAKEAEGGMADAAKGAEKLKKELDEVKKSAEEDFKPLNDKLKELNEQFKELDQRIHAATEASTRQAWRVMRLAPAGSPPAVADIGCGCARPPTSAAGCRSPYRRARGGTR